MDDMNTMNDGTDMNGAAPADGAVPADATMGGTPVDPMAVDPMAVDPMAAPAGDVLEEMADGAEAPEGGEDDDAMADMA